MATKMIRVSESDAEWLTAFAGELQTARASRVSLAEAVSTLIVEHQNREELLNCLRELVSEDELIKCLQKARK